MTKRSNRQRRERREIYVCVEGNTEDQYLTDWSRRMRRTVWLNIDPIRADPRTLVSRAREVKRDQEYEERHGRGKKFDEYWCVFDVDEHQNISEAIEEARLGGISVAVSNPCIELWFVLHFERQTAEIDRFVAQRKSRGYLRCEKNLSRNALAELFARHETALINEEHVADRHVSAGNGRQANPSSGLRGLVSSILRT